MSTIDENSELRRGPWTLEEDSLLMLYIAAHGEGRWDLLAKSSGLKRTGKSCRLRWLNYLKPDVKRGNLTLEEQVLILELHSKWGNRWSRIARHLPGRTDNEIKNYWRTRVQKHARQLKLDANSPRFRDMIRCFWVPRLVQKIEENNRSSTISTPTPQGPEASLSPPPPPPVQGSFSESCFNHDEYNSSLETSDSPSVSLSVPEASAYPPTSPCAIGNSVYNPYFDCLELDPLSAMGSFGNTVSNCQLADTMSNCQLAENNWVGDEMGDSLWNMDELWQFTKLQPSST